MNDEERLTATINRDTRVQLALVVTLCGALAIGTWRWASLETTVNQMRVDLHQLRDSAVDGSRNRWTSEMQAEYEQRVANDIDFIRRQYERGDERLDNIEAALIKLDGNFRPAR
jgi:hypothetical protein